MRSLSFDQLRAFIEVAKRGSFTAAANELNLTQPAITHQVHELEQRFNVPLLDRIGKRAYPTEAGEKLLEHARYLLDEDARTRAAMRKFADGWLGRVRSMTVLMYVLPPILRKLKTKYPHLEINLKANLTSTTLQLLKSNALDLGLARFRSRRRVSTSFLFSRMSLWPFCRPRLARRRKKRPRPFLQNVR
jgi:DNA-binding transcriptional LysR family regulator